MIAIDLNCDLGEVPQFVLDGTDDAILACVSSANVACGGHAGDRASMERTVRAAMLRGVAIGAHPGYPDRAGFGRRELRSGPAEVEAFVVAQVGALREVASLAGATLSHVKPHGALYHAAIRERALAEAIGRAVASVSRDVVLVGLAGSPVLDDWRAMGFRVAGEAFADRRYEPDGSLRGRAHEDAVIENSADAAAQAVRIATGAGVVSCAGAVVPIRADTICVHGDTRGAVAIARAVRSALEAAGVQVAPLRPRR